MDSSFVATIAVVPDDSGGGDEDKHNGVRLVSWPGGYCAAKTTPLFKTLALRVLQYPLKPAAPER